MKSHDTLARYHRHLVKFTAIWILVGVAGLLYDGAVVEPAGLEGVAELMVGPLGFVALVSTGFGFIFLAKSFVSQRPPLEVHLYLVGGAMVCLSPACMALIIYSVFATTEPVTLLLVVSITFVWMGVANLIALRIVAFLDL